jgi:hypothetical protein
MDLEFEPSQSNQLLENLQVVWFGSGFGTDHYVRFRFSSVSDLYQGSGLVPNPDRSQAT